MRAISIFLVASCSSAASTTPSIGAAEPVRTVALATSSYCSQALGPWSFEAFPGCPPLQYLNWAFICQGATCGRPCRMTSTNSQGEHSYDRDVRISYDERRRFVSAVFPDGAALMACAYTGDKMTECNGQTVERDPRGRIVLIRAKPGDDRPDEIVRYDAAGRLVAVGDRELRYDANGRITFDGGATIEHDDAGRVTREQKQGQTRTYTYERGRLVHYQDADANGGYEYDAQGRLVRAHHGGIETSGSTTYHYDCAR